jgi:hypothetical protein
MMPAFYRLALARLADHALPEPGRMKRFPGIAQSISLPKLAVHALRTSIIEVTRLFRASCGAFLALAILPFGSAAVDLDKPADPIFSEGLGLPLRAASALNMSNIA